MLLLHILALASFVKSETFKIGFLSGNRERNGQPNIALPGILISPAIKVAIDEINRNSYLPYNHSLDYILAETYGEENESILQTAALWRKNISAFIGPQETCMYEAKLASSLNLPMISHFCTHPEPSNKDLYPTFARTKPPSSFVSKSLMAILRQHNWTQIALFHSNINDSTYDDATSAIISEFENDTKYKILVQKSWSEMYHYGWAEKEMFETWIQEVKNQARIFLIIGDSDAHLGLLNAMSKQGLFSDDILDEYFVIGIDLSVWNEKKAELYLKGVLSDPTLDAQESILQGMRHYVRIMISPPLESDFWTFTKAVKKVMTEPPFDDYIANANALQMLILRREAAFLYDAVKLYAAALKEMLLNGEDPMNGKALIQKLFKTHYKSVLGYTVYLDENGDAQGNYTLVALDRKNNLTGLYPYGKFVINGSRQQLILEQPLQWSRGRPPLDRPPCGFEGQLCVFEYAKRDIIMGISILFAIVFSVVIIVAYKNYTYEQELDSLLWKIDSSALQEDEYTPTRHHNKNASQNSLNSHCEIGGDETKFSHIFTRVGFYKGQIYAMKKFDSLKFDLTRSAKKELKHLRDLKHDNIIQFIGACVEPQLLCIVTEYCTRGSLKDILKNEEIKLDNMFVASLVFDIIRGMIYLHDSPVGYHANLKPSNCLVDSRWVLKLADFGPQSFKKPPDFEVACEQHVYVAPELLRNSMRGITNFDLISLQKMDTYSFAIILYELHSRKSPYEDHKLTLDEVLLRLKYPENGNYLRPNLDNLVPTDVSECITNVLNESWTEPSFDRPDFKVIRNKLRPLRKGMRANIIDNMVAMMEKYADNLEVLVDERTHQLEEEKRKTDALLQQMLPKPVAEQLKQGKSVEAESFECVTIFFSDIVGFTKMCAVSNPLQVVDFLNDLYTCFDESLENFDVYKVETIGDAYMVASGVPLRNGDQHAGEIASFALELLDSVHRFSIRHRPTEILKLRIGLHSGPVCSGVVGRKMPRFCLFGDTVNTASRMESTGEPLKIHCSSPCKIKLESLGGYHFQERGQTELKGKGIMTTYWLTGQDLTPARLKAWTVKRNKSLPFSGSNQELDFFKSNLSSRRGSSRSRRSGSFIDREPSSPYLKKDSITCTAVAFAVNNQFSVTAKPLAKIDPLSRERKSRDENMFLQVPNERRRTKEENVYLPISRIPTSITVSRCSSERSLTSDLKAAVPEKDDHEKKKRNLQFNLTEEQSPLLY